MGKNKVRHNTIDVRAVAITGDSAVISNYKGRDTRYDDLFIDYKAQQKNVYIKPKRAFRVWQKANVPVIHNGKVHTIVKGDSHIMTRLKRQRLYKELGM